MLESCWDHKLGPDGFRPVWETSGAEPEGLLGPTVALEQGGAELFGWRFTRAPGSGGGLELFRSPAPPRVKEIFGSDIALDKGRVPGFDSFLFGPAIPLDTTGADSEELTELYCLDTGEIFDWSPAEPQGTRFIEMLTFSPVEELETAAKDLEIGPLAKALDTGLTVEWLEIGLTVTTLGTGLAVNALETGLTVTALGSGLSINRLETDATEESLCPESVNGVVAAELSFLGCIKPLGAEDNEIFSLLIGSLHSPVDFVQRYSFSIKISSSS